MNNDYKDITSRIAEPPTWWDCNAVPRYGDFNPEAVPNIYADEVVLFLVRCQSCAREFHVALDEAMSFLRDIQEKTLEYSDPPAHDCIGDSMNSIPVKVIEYWRRQECEWTHYPEFAGADLVPDWAKDDNPRASA